MYQKQSRNTNRSTDTIASFLLKTYEILEHPQYQKMICWDKNNLGFVINDVVQFTKEILPKYFRHSNFSSFVRQLNMYDFHKVKQENDSLVFKNPLFFKGEQQNLKFIRRKAAKKVNGQRRQQSNQKNDLENQKYENLVKAFKKSLETEINQSSIFYQKSIQLIKQLNQSNQKKAAHLKKLYVQDKCQSLDNENIEKNNLPNELTNQQNTMQQRQKIKLKQEHKQNIQPSKKSNQSSSEPKSLRLNLDNVIVLKQEVYKSIGIFQNWLNEYIQTQKKKVKFINSYKNQLDKCLLKSNENLGSNENINAQDEYQDQDQVVHNSAQYQVPNQDKKIEINEIALKKQINSQQHFNNMISNELVIPKNQTQSNSNNKKAQQEKVILPLLSAKKIASVEQKLQQNIRTNLFPNSSPKQNTLIQSNLPRRQSFSTFKSFQQPIFPSKTGFTPLSSFVNKGGFMLPSNSQRSFIIPIISQHKQQIIEKEEQSLSHNQRNNNKKVQSSSQNENIQQQMNQ